MEYVLLLRCCYGSLLKSLFTDAPFTGPEPRQAAQHRTVHGDDASRYGESTTKSIFTSLQLVLCWFATGCSPTPKSGKGFTPPDHASDLDLATGRIGCGDGRSLYQSILHIDTIHVEEPSADSSAIVCIPSFDIK